MKITKLDIEAFIVSEHIFVARDGVSGALAQMNLFQNHAEFDSSKPVEYIVNHDPLSLVTICLLVLKNGAVIVGKSICADPLEFDAELGRVAARNDAINQVWPFLGFQLRDELARVKSGVMVGGLLGE